MYSGYSRHIFYVTADPIQVRIRTVATTTKTTTTAAAAKETTTTTTTTTTISIQSAFELMKERNSQVVTLFVTNTMLLSIACIWTKNYMCLFVAFKGSVQ